MYNVKENDFIMPLFNYVTSGLILSVYFSVGSHAPELCS